MRWALSHLKPARLRTSSVPVTAAYSFWATACPGLPQTVLEANEKIAENATVSGGFEATAP